MAALDLTSFDFALKEYYTDDKINELVYEDNPFLEMVPKDENFYGDVLPVPVIYGNPQGRSASLANAITNQTATKGVKFNLTRAKDYATASIDHETLKASEKDKGAFIEAATTELNGAMTQISRSLATALYGTGSGSVGKIASGQTTVTITLTEISDVHNFEVGQVLVVSVADGGGAVRAGTQTLTAIDRNLGTLTGAVAWNDASRIPAIAANDFLFVQGDYDSKVKGLKAWVPSATPSATAFFGVDRTADPVRLAGVRFDGSLLPIEEAFVEGLNRTEVFGGKPDYIFCNPAQWRALEKALGSKVIYNDSMKGGTATVGFRGIVMSGKKGMVTVIGDQNCPNTLAYVITMKTMKLRSLGKAPTLFETDSLKWTRGATTDDLSLRIYYYAQLACNAPGWNGVITLTSTGGI